MIMKTTILKPTPENVGRPATSCATPKVNGFRVADAKPKPVASKLIPRPVSESHPRA